MRRSELKSIFKTFPWLVSLWGWIYTLSMPFIFIGGLIVVILWLIIDALIEEVTKENLLYFWNNLLTIREQIFEPIEDDVSDNSEKTKPKN